MKRLLVSLLLACACSGAPSQAIPAAASASAPAAASSAKAPRVRSPWIELGGSDKDTVLTGHAADGTVAYELHLKYPQAIIAAPDGGAYAVLLEPTQYSPGRAVQVRALVGIDPDGHEMWRHRVTEAGWKWRLFATRERLLAVDLDRKRLHLFVAFTGKTIDEVALPPTTSDVDEEAGVLSIAHDGGVARLGLDGKTLWDLRVQLFPSPDPSVARSPGRRVAVGADGTILSGASDGSLVAVDEDGAPLYQLGVRGAVARIGARSDGDFEVQAAGPAIAIGPGGVVRAALAPEAAATDPALSAAPRLVDRRPGAAAAAPPPAWQPTVAYRAERAHQDGKPLRGVGSVVAMAPDDVWALVAGDLAPGQTTLEYRLFHHDGAGWSDLGIPAVSFDEQVFAEGEPAARGTFEVSLLGRAPSGALLAVGVRQAGATRRPCVLERVGAGWRDRAELRATLAKIPMSWHMFPDLTYAASAGGREVLCYGDRGSQWEMLSTCVDLAGAGTVLSAEEGRTMDDGPGEIPGQGGSFLRPILFAGETLWKANGWAGGEAAIWSLGGTTLTHHDGKGSKSHESPFALLRSAWGSAADDLWLTGERGLARFDSKRFWRILAIDPAGSDLLVTGSGRGDVWAYGRAGLWRVTPAAGAEADLEAALGSAPPVTTTSRALRVGAVDPAYRLERVELAIDGARPLRSAVSVARGPGGVLWFYDGARLVEHDGATSRVLYQPTAPEPFVCWSNPEPDCEFCASCTERKPEPLGCQGCVAATAVGRGAMIADGGVLSIRDGGAASVPLELPGLLALGATPSGRIWAVTAQADDDLPHALLLGPAGPRLVSGLPPAAYAAVAARSDDDVWLAGGLTTAETDDGRVRPEGEGTLLHLDGRHAEGRRFARYRAPDGALIAVAASAPAEAWAVGVGGGIMHVKAGVAEAFHLESSAGARLPRILRAVAAAGPSDVWLAGDASTLLHFDGRELRAIEATATGKKAPLTAILAPTTEPGWLVGPTGIWRIVRQR